MSRSRRTADHQAAVREAGAFVVAQLRERRQQPAQHIEPAETPGRPHHADESTDAALRRALIAQGLLMPDDETGEAVA